MAEPKEIPVYLFRGFLESGKTSFIMNTIQDPYFYNGEKTLIIACEEGEEEYDPAVLAKYNCVLESVEEQEDLSAAFLERLNDKYKPDRVIIEYNGTWILGDTLMIVSPDDWVYVQTICTVDASTYQSYMANMGSLMVEQYRNADMVLFNRCDENSRKSFMRSNVKAVNRPAQILYEAAEGHEFNDQEDDLPFDVNASVIEIADDDYGLWYMDALDHPDKYKGKTVRFKAMAYRGPRFAKNVIVPGRHAMTCCADDIAFVGFMCKGDACKNVQKRDWITVTAQVKVEFIPAYKEKGPMLYAQKIEKAEPPKEQLVYFT
ncbi:MAG: GTP-binding protein [Lachnospiraceae bacterium]|nr:GTP-binding protein [Lachnospiraceae bacterium]